MHMCIILFFVFHTTTCTVINLTARQRPSLNGMIELTGAIADKLSRSRLACFLKCVKIYKCLTFFYNDYMGRCVMHSRHFIWHTPRTTEPGWTYYITEDVSGRCPSSDYFYRYLDLCYNVDTVQSIDFTMIKTLCTDKGGSLAAITTQELQDYFVHFLDGRPLSHQRVCLAGNVELDGKVKLDNGTVLTYNKWAVGEPNWPGVENCLQLLSNGYWNNMECVWPDQAVYVCEI